MPSIFIAHRGNVYGPNDRENTEDYIREALDEGFDVEVDVWFLNGEWFLGHDKPEHKTTLHFLQNNKLWCHAKHLPALSEIMTKYQDTIHTFSHNEDPVILTSRGYLWVYPGCPIDKESICVMPERVFYSWEELQTCKGVCSDYVYLYRNRF